MITKSHLAKGRHVVRTVQHTLETQLGLQPVFREYVITQSNAGTVILFAVLDARRVAGKLSAYIRPEVLHQISTNLKGMPVGVSNSSGVRYAVPLNQPRPLPKRVDFPGTERGWFRIGVRANRKAVAVPWEELGHLLVAGQTGSGKSVFLRSIVYQAIADGQQALLADRNRTTLPMLGGHPALLGEIAVEPEAYHALVAQARGICQQRAQAYAACPAYPEKLSEYNAWAVRNGLAPLPRVLVALEEYNATLVDMGGPTGKFGQAVKALAMEGRKFGVTLVIASQEFEKRALGALRSQMRTVVALHTLDGGTARNLGVPQAAQIPDGRPGLAATNRWGLVQTYYLPKERLLALGGGARPDVLTPEEQALVARAVQESGGRLSRPLMEKWGWGQRPARRLLTEWETRGWLRRDPHRDNARYVTDALVEIAGL